MPGDNPQRRQLALVLQRADRFDGEIEQLRRGRGVDQPRCLAFDEEGCAQQRLWQQRRRLLQLPDAARGHRRVSSGAYPSFCGLLFLVFSLAPILKCALEA